MQAPSEKSKVCYNLAASVLCCTEQHTEIQSLQFQSLNESAREPSPRVRESSRASSLASQTSSSPKAPCGKNDSFKDRSLLPDFWVPPSIVQLASLCNPSTIKCVPLNGVFITNVGRTASVAATSCSDYS